ncbi:MAG: cellulase family glycosylhydrolase [Bacteroidetes bacterium]|nr:cellulase family glycosylhydrolase [Bacteroidota bacterium]
MTMPLRNLSALLFLLVLFISCSQNDVTAPEKEPVITDTTSAPTASAVILAMGTGFNLGNTFDLSQHPATVESIRPIIDLYYSAGLRHIRIPVTWRDGFGGNTLANADGRVNTLHPRFLQLKAVIDYALQKKMIVVLNAHHEHWLKQHYDGTPVYDTIFTALWRDIAVYFRDYPYELVFELLNEPEGAFGDWNGGTTPNDPMGLALTRYINVVGWKAVRGTGGRNARRVIMLSTNGQGNHSQIDDVFPEKTALPGAGTDPYLAVQVHTYDPWSFCGENGSNSAWPGSATLTNSIAAVAAHAKKLGVPVNYGEFGVGRAAHPEERDTDIVRGYYRTIRLAVLSEGMSATFWDDRGWFALIAKDGTGTYSFLHNIIPTVMAP